MKDKKWNKTLFIVISITYVVLGIFLVFAVAKENGDCFSAVVLFWIFLFLCYSLFHLLRIKRWKIVFLYPIVIGFLLLMWISERFHSFICNQY